MLWGRFCVIFSCQTVLLYTSSDQISGFICTITFQHKLQPYSIVSDCVATHTRAVYGYRRTWDNVIFMKLALHVTYTYMRKPYLTGESMKNHKCAHHRKGQTNAWNLRYLPSQKEFKNLCSMPMDLQVMAASLRNVNSVMHDQYFFLVLVYHLLSLTITFISPK